MTSVDQLSARVRDELANFAIAATAFEEKNITILGWDGPAAALAWLQQRSVSVHG